MVTLPAQKTIRWLAPAPMWRGDGTRLAHPDHRTLVRPAILRFANDAFVEELLAMLNHAPWRLREWIAQPETWREPMRSPEPVTRTAPLSGAPRPYNGARLLQGGLTSHRRALVAAHGFTTAAPQETESEPPIKLYQASQQRFYVVAASLTSSAPGCPDYDIDLAKNERATFVVRALKLREEAGGTPSGTRRTAAPAQLWDEYAFVTTPFGPAWQKVGPHDTGGGDAATRSLVPGEEQMGSFVVTYEDHCDRKHQLVGGLIPVGRREEWLRAPEAGADVDTQLAHPVPSEPGGAVLLNEIFRSSVIEPWKALVEQAEVARRSGQVDGSTFPNFDFEEDKALDDRARMLRDTRDKIQTGSWYVLLDFAEFLERHLPEVWAVVAGEGSPSSLDASERAIVTALRAARLPARQRFVVALENLLVSKPALDGGLWQTLTKLWELEEYLEMDRWPPSGAGFPESALEIIESAEIGDDMRRRFDDAGELMNEPWYTVLDLLRTIEQVTPNGTGPSRVRSAALGEWSSLNAVEAFIVTRLQDADPSGDFGVEGLSPRKLTIAHSLLDALVAVRRHEDALGGQGLEAVDVPYARVARPADEPPEAEPTPPIIDPRWPSFLFPLADPDPDLDATTTVPVPSLDTSTLPDPAGPRRAAAALAAVEAAIESFASAVDAQAARGVDTPAAMVVPDPKPALHQRNTRFVMRCVFERPWCGELFPALVSPPTRQFELAPFFDPDAPARSIRVQLPVDISPASLRKFKKNTGFLISDMLCGKLKKIRKLTLADMVLDVLPWPFHKDLPRAGPTGPCLTNGQRLGMVCSLSIPIVTLCALILLFIIVALFDRFFRWIPYLFMCFGIDLTGKDD